MEIDFRWPVLLITSLILLVIVRALNGLCEPYGIHLSVGALYLLMPAMLLRLRGALILIALIALLIDAYNPYLFGLHLVIFGIFVTILHINRSALFRATRRQTLISLLLINLIIIVLEALFLGWSWLFYGTYIYRIFIDLILSELLLIPLGLLFLDLQQWTLRVIRCNMAPPD